MDIKDCFDQRLLRKIKPDLEKSNTSIKIAEQKLKESQELLEKDFPNQSIVTTYTAMFHAARALLYKDGIQEKSHFAVNVYLKEKYSKRIPLELLNAFEHYRLQRHEILYGINIQPNNGDAKDAIEQTESFIDKIKLLVK